MALTRPREDLMALSLQGLGISGIALALAGSMSMPQRNIRKPNNSPKVRHICPSFSDSYKHTGTGAWYIGIKDGHNVIGI
jgi:hypothetical protein